MKISLKQANELLKKLGVNAAVVESEDKADKDADLEALATGATESIVAGAKEDIEAAYAETELAKLVGSETGKLLGTIRSQFVKNFGGTNKEYTEADGKQLDIAGMVALAKSKFESRVGQEKNSWEAERNDLIEAHEAELARITQEKDGEIGNWKNKYADRDINENLIKITEKIPRSKGEVTEHADFLRYKLQKQGYELKYNEEGKSLELWKDGKKSKDALEDKAKQVFTDNGLLVTDTRHINPAKVKDGSETNAAAGIQTIPVNTNMPDNFAALAAELNEG